MPANVKPMSPSQALALAKCLIEFELEEPQVLPPPPDWMSDLERAAATITALWEQQRPPPLPRENLGFCRSKRKHYG